MKEENNNCLWNTLKIRTGEDWSRVIFQRVLRKSLKKFFGTWRGVQRNQSKNSNILYNVSETILLRHCAMKEEDLNNFLNDRSVTGSVTKSKALTRSALAFWQQSSRSLNRVEKFSVLQDILLASRQHPWRGCFQHVLVGAGKKAKGRCCDVDTTFVATKVSSSSPLSK